MQYIKTVTGNQDFIHLAFSQWELDILKFHGKKQS